MSATAAPVSTPPPSERVLSVDVLRGFDMFWIIGGGGIVHALHEFGSNPVTDFFENQLEHREWEGFVFYDLIFPLFVFLVGMSVVFSMRRIDRAEGSRGVHRRIFKRTAIMFALGLVYSGGITNGFEGLRVMGVLQRLALCYMFAALLFYHLNTRQLIGVCVALLLGYWALLSFVPVPGVGHASFAMGENWANYLDDKLLPFRRYNGTWDPEGLLSTLPAVASCLLGVFAALFLKDGQIDPKKKGRVFLGAGVLLVVLGELWGLQCPVIKKIWTPSYVLVAGGYSCILLAIFYQVIDVWKWRAWIPPFLWIGSNALAVYLARNLIGFDAIAERLVGGEGHGLPGAWGTLAVTALSLGLILLFARFLYKRQVFIRI